MKIHEYQAKEILRQYGVKTLKGVVCQTVEDAENAANELGYPCVIKAQIHAGGRGKGGGVKLAKTAAEASEYASAILGMQLKTHQTGPEGQLVRKIFVEAGCAIARELYVGLVLDRDTSQVCVMASTEGGVEIEKVAEETPERILKVWIDPITGMMPYQARELAFGLDLQGPQVKDAVNFFLGLYQAFVKSDASLAEINPLVITQDDQVMALDAKFNFDDNAMYRQKQIAQMHDPDEEDPRELEAHEYDLSYVALDGNIGCMVNGAGLAMSTMDVIKHVGGEPANFLDVGGSATKEKVTEAFKIILRDEKVKAVFVNIFGGIAKCDIIAAGVTAAARDLGLTQPLVVRLAGTNVEKGKQILAESGLKIIPADDMLDGAQKAVEAANL
jgi:succinyl-CoA synthetase beta subunit